MCHAYPPTSVPVRAMHRFDAAAIPPMASACMESADLYSCASSNTVQSKNPRIFFWMMRDGAYRIGLPVSCQRTSPQSHSRRADPFLK